MNLTTMLNLLILTCIIVYIIDISGFVDEILKRIYDKYIKVGDYNQLKPKLKPFTCSLCSSFWAGLIYLIATAQLNILMIGYVCLLSSLTPIIGDVFILIKDALNKIINLIYKLID